MTRRIVYMGTPDFSVPALEILAASDMADVALVVTQPDRLAGRGRKLLSPAVKTAADRLGLPVLQTGTLRDPEIRRRIIDIEPDLIVVAAFGMILGKWILELPNRGCVNLHASLLPEYRGANPIAAAIAMGETTTGVTLMHMDRGLDTGDMYETASLDILEDDTTESLTSRLAELAANLLKHNLSGLLNGSLVATPQGTGATLTRQMTKNDGWLNFSRSGEELECHVRAMWPWPRAWTTTVAGDRIQVHEARVDLNVRPEPGEIAHAGNRVLVGTGDGALELVRIQLPGGRPIEGNGIGQAAALAEGQRLGRSHGPGEVPPLVMPVDPS
jgi:methionyl-tRNA formyltransferase